MCIRSPFLAALHADPSLVRIYRLCARLALFPSGFLIWQLRFDISVHSLWPVDLIVCRDLLIHFDQAPHIPIPSYHATSHPITPVSSHPIPPIASNLLVSPSCSISSCFYISHRPRQSLPSQSLPVTVPTRLTLRRPPASHIQPHPAPSPCRIRTVPGGGSFYMAGARHPFTAGPRCRNPPPDLKLGRKVLPIQLLPGLDQPVREPHLYKRAWDEVVRELMRTRAVPPLA